MPSLSPKYLAHNTHRMFDKLMNASFSWQRIPNPFCNERYIQKKSAWAQGDLPHQGIASRDFQRAQRCAFPPCDYQPCRERVFMASKNQKRKAQSHGQLLLSTCPSMGEWDARRGRRKRRARVDLAYTLAQWWSPKPEPGPYCRKGHMESIFSSRFFPDPLSLVLRLLHPFNTYSQKSIWE